MTDPGFRATTVEYQASLFGSLVIGLGIGALVAKFLPGWVGVLAILFGVLVHGWGMWRINRRSQ